MTTLVGTITELRRLPNSEKGNPAWAFKLVFDEGPPTRELRTRKDIDDAHLLSPIHEGRKVRVELLSGFRTVDRIELL